MEQQILAAGGAIPMLE
uniref:Uncharacterized protein n=1 Tax=Nymphaea colorata TaxID=210225 RepID=A0A5K1BH50_9MAGN